MSQSFMEQNHNGPEPSGRRSKGPVFGGRTAGILILALLAAGAAVLLIFTDGAGTVRELLMMQSMPQLTMGAGYGMIFAIGVLTSFHCAGMCGGIAVSQSLRAAGRVRAGETPRKAAGFFPTLRYNAGRVISYTAAGGIAGGLGHAVQLTGAWRGLVPLFGGAFMVIMGINLLGIWKALRRLNLRMPYFAARKISGGAARLGPFSVGLLSGLMPCGPLQIMQLYALGSGSALNGALSLLVFSLGTVPMLFLFGALNSLLSKRFTVSVTKISAVIIIVLGGVMLERGLALSGVSIGHRHVTITADTGIARLDGGGAGQTVVTRVGKSSYAPIIVQKGVPVAWNLQADAEDLNSCNETVVLPEFHLEKKLAAGDNWIRFTPQKEGEFIYTCWMGMIKSTIAVVEDVSRYKGGSGAWSAAAGGAQGLCMLPAAALPQADDLKAAGASEQAGGVTEQARGASERVRGTTEQAGGSEQIEAAGPGSSRGAVKAAAAPAAGVSADTAAASSAGGSAQPASGGSSGADASKGGSSAPAGETPENAAASAPAGGEAPSPSPAVDAAEEAAAEGQNGKQTAVTVVGADSYSPIVVKKGVPVRWVIRAGEKELNSCNERIVAPDFNLEIKLAAGDNVLEFTPQEAGTFPFTCWMNMIESSITVVE